MAARAGAPCAAHPRSRGEHTGVPVAPIYHTGSSPLARGTSVQAWERLRAHRLIPARAGNILSCFCNCVYMPGSSPLARGTSHDYKIKVQLLRLIPARAGNILSADLFLSAFSAHPRSRGEHKETEMFSRLNAGSSPLARGTCEPRDQAARSTRLIPARAGNMRSLMQLMSALAAHPRSRGEHPWR